MSRDPWRDAIRVRRGDPAQLYAFLVELPADGPQHAGNAVLTLERGSVSEAMAVELFAALRDRAWTGDDELAAAIERHQLGFEPAGLVPISVSLEDLAEVLDESVASESFIDLESGVVWSGQLLDVGLFVPPELDRVVHAAQDPGGVGHRFLVTQLRARRIEVGHVGTLIERRHLER